MTRANKTRAHAGKSSVGICQRDTYRAKSESESLTDLDREHDATPAVLSEHKLTVSCLMAATELDSFRGR